MADYEHVIKRMQEYYEKNGRSKPLPYSFGFFDALSVIKEIQEEDKMK